MKKFVLKCLCFFIASYFLSLIIDIVISKNVQPSGLFISWQDLYSGDIDADLLIIGSSRTQYGFNTKIIEDSLHIKTYNLGLTSARIQIDYIRLLEQLRLGKHKPKYVTLEIDFVTIEKKNRLDCHWQLFPYMLYNKNIYKYTHNMDGYKKGYYFCPLARYYGNFSDLITNSISDINIGYYKGYWPMNEPFNGTRFTTKDTIKIDSPKIELLSEFINTCKGNDIKLNFVYSPEYYLISHNITNRDSITNIIKNIAQRNDIPFADISTPPFSTDTTFFFDMRHLNSLGADKFTSEYYVPWIKELYGL